MFKETLRSVRSEKKKRNKCRAQKRKWQAFTPEDRSRPKESDEFDEMEIDNIVMGG